MNSLLAKLHPVITFVKRYAVILGVLLFAGIYGYLVQTSSQMASRTPSESKISESYKSSNRPSVEETVINKIKELQDQNVQFQALLDEARKNPFLE